MRRLGRAKCPRCLPDSPHACFSWWGSDEKRCNNCGHVLKVRKRPTGNGKPTRRQQRILDRIASAFGGTLEVAMHGRNVWMSLKNYEGRKWFEGQCAFGTIGVMGKLDITLPRVIADDVKIRDMIGVEVYLTTAKPVPTP